MLETPSIQQYQAPEMVLGENLLVRTISREDQALKKCSEPSETTRKTPREITEMI